MGRLVLIDAIAAAVLFGAWFFYFTRYNRRKGALALRWVESACSNKGKVLDSTLAGRGSASGPLRLHRALVRQCPSNHPVAAAPDSLQVVRQRLAQAKRDGTFEADLDYAPSFQLDVFRHRWLSQRHGNLTADSREWSVSRPGPVVLTTRTRWTQELSPVVNTLMTLSRTQSDQRSFPLRIPPSCCHGSSRSTIRRAGGRWISQRASRARRSVSLTPVGLETATSWGTSVPKESPP